MSRTKMTPKRRELFCAALAEGLSVTAACKRIDASRQTAYVFRSSYPDFAAAWDDAYERGTDKLEDVALDLATVGETEDVFYKGKIVGQRRRRSENVLLRLLSARRPGKYRDNAKIEVDSNQLDAFAKAIMGVATAPPPSEEDEPKEAE